VRGRVGPGRCPYCRRFVLTRWARHLYFCRAIEPHDDDDRDPLAWEDEGDAA
jgi:hypothetical protein